MTFPTHTSRRMSWCRDLRTRQLEHLGADLIIGATPSRTARSSCGRQATWDPSLSPRVSGCQGDRP